MISFKNVGVSKGGRDILKNISVSLNDKRIGVIGHNSSGKSTFVKLINGLEQCTSGQVVFDDVQENSEKKIRKNVGFVFQNPDNQIVFSLVEEDIAYGLKKSGLSKAEIKNRVHEYLIRFGLEHLYGRFTHELSGGEKQLVALIGVLIIEPRYIILDEPTTLLDLKNRSMLIKTLRTLEQTLIIVSHDLEFMTEMDHLLVIHEGGLYQEGEPEKMLEVYRGLSEC